MFLRKPAGRERWEVRAVPQRPRLDETPDALGSEAVRSMGLEEEGSPSGTSLPRVSHPLTLRETLVSVPASQVQIL